MNHATEIFGKKRTDAFAAKPIEEWREEASEIRMNVLADLSQYVDAFAASATKAGAIVYRAADASMACSIVGNILKDRNVRKVVKSKSMVTEEIALNSHLENSALEVVETDLGEYIIQLAQEHPSHIIVPAIHKNRQQVGKLFASRLQLDYSEDPFTLTKMARRILRRHFLTAQAGISGANFAISDSGSIVIFTNEGNGRMVTTLPPLHIVVVSIEKMLPSLSVLPKFMRLLPRSATGQTMTSYMSVISGTRRKDDTTGARELHIVLVDNGRSDVLKGEFFEILKCIRCGACMNSCPVYRLVGGHAYESTYPGPMGIILTTLLEGMQKAHPLLDATTLCGACADVCPVKVPLPMILRRLREKRHEAGFLPVGERGAMSLFGLAAGSRSAFHVSQSFSRALWATASKRSPTLKRMPRPAAQFLRQR
jgi:L-lactate dehydrogenase complex protein LldF